MSIITRHLEPIRRIFNTGLPVQNIGYIAEKNDIIQRVFTTFNFSFILSGSGYYTMNDRRMPIVAPCVITQSPGIMMNYGPEPVWEELYFIYDKKSGPALKKRGFFNPGQPLWYLRSGSLLNEKLRELTRMLEGIDEPGMADRVDLQCEAIIMESLLHRTDSPIDDEERLIRTIESELRNTISAPRDYNQLAGRYGLHPMRFRRYWNRYIGVPPAKYVAQLRMSEAGRLLVETAMSVGEIARTVGYIDELYFSRKFRKVYGVTATSYRKRHQENLSLRNFPKTVTVTQLGEKRNT